MYFVCVVSSYCVLLIVVVVIFIVVFLYLCLSQGTIVNQHLVAELSSLSKYH